MKRALPASLVFALALTLFAATTHRRVFTAGNDATRWATIESIGDRGTSTIDESRFAANVDRVRLDGRSYSNKPPLLAGLGAATYAAVRAITGWTFSGPGAAQLLFVLVVSLVGVPAAWLVTRFHGELARFGAISVRGRTLLTLALAAGTLLWPYATTLNSHVPAAALLFAALGCAMAGRGLGAGLCCGLAAGFDLLPALGLAPALGMMLRPVGSASVQRFAVALAGCGLFLAGLNLAHHGSILPIKMVAGAVDLSARAGPSLWGVVLPQSASYPFEILFGAHGLFVVSPVLGFGLAGLVRACRTDAQSGPMSRSAWRWLAMAIGAQIVIHAAVAGSYGGWSYGFRYLLPVQPLLLYAAPLALGGASWRRVLFAVALGASILFSALGAYHPWPPAFEQETARHPVASTVRNPIGGNAAAWFAEHAHDSAISRFLTRQFVSEDPAMARAYFALFFGSKGDFEQLRRFRP